MKCNEQKMKWFSDQKRQRELWFNTLQLVRLNEIKIKVYLKLYKDIFKGTDFGGEEELAIKKLCSGGKQGCDGERCRLIGWLAELDEKVNVEMDIKVGRND